MPSGLCCHSKEGQSRKGPEKSARTPLSGFQVGRPGPERGKCWPSDEGVVMSGAQFFSVYQVVK